MFKLAAFETGVFDAKFLPKNSPATRAAYLFAAWIQLVEDNWWKATKDILAVPTGTYEFLLESPTDGMSSTSETGSLAVRETADIQEAAHIVDGMQNGTT